MLSRLARAVVVLGVIVPGIGAAVAAADPAGYALLDKFVAQFEQAARQGSSGAALDPALGEMITLARKARDEQRIDATFFDRYARVIRVFKLATTKDPDQILRPVVDREIREFVRDVSGEEKADIGSFATAIAREIDSLRASLGGR
jgi:hypothetical protein